MRRRFSVRLTVLGCGRMHTGFERFERHRLFGAQYLHQFFAGMTYRFKIGSSCLHVSGARIDSFLSGGAGFDHRALGIAMT